MTEPVFSWIHLSDLHIGHEDEGTRSHQKRVIEGVANDAKNLLDRGVIPRPRAVLVTGDIGFSGGSRGGATNTEYREAEDALLRIACALGLGPKDIFMVPGNHDVDRMAAQTRRDISYLNNIREKGGLDKELETPDFKDLLLKRFGRYQAMARGFADKCDDVIVWSRSVNDFVTLVGINTALLAQVEKDHDKWPDEGKLWIAHRQLEELKTLRERVVIVLTHHPLEGWIVQKDANANIHTLLRQGATMHLCGHVHGDSDQQWELDQKVGHNQCLTLVAGAVHAPSAHVPQANQALPVHGYSYGALYAEDAPTNATVRVWPRTWSHRRGKFLADLASVGSDSTNTSLSVSIPDGSRLPRRSTNTPYSLVRRLHNKDAIEPAEVVRIVLEHFEASWPSEGASPPMTTNYGVIRAELDHLADPAINRAYAIDHFDPYIWAASQAYYWLALQARRYVKDNYLTAAHKASVDAQPHAEHSLQHFAAPKGGKWDIQFSKEVLDAIERSTANIKPTFPESKTPFDDAPRGTAPHRNHAGVPQFEVARILVWEREWLKLPFVRNLISMHSAFNIPLFFVDKAGTKVALDAEYLILCRAEDTSETRASNLNGSLWPPSPELPKFLRFTRTIEKPLEHFHNLLKDPEILLAADALQLTDYNRWDEHEKSRNH